MSPSKKYERYLQNSHWREVRRKALERADGNCEHCGVHRQNGDLHVHHKDYSDLGNEDLRQVEVLCLGCHKHRHPGWANAAPRNFSVSSVASAASGLRSARDSRST